MKQKKDKEKKGKEEVEEESKEDEKTEDSTSDVEATTPDIKKVSSFNSSEQGKGRTGSTSSSELTKNPFDTKVQFKDFEILKVIGEGSFGRVYKGKKKDTGQIIALKVMKKQYLINNNQVKYAVSEAQIMKELDHPFILKLVFSF